MRMMKILKGCRLSFVDCYYGDENSYPVAIADDNKVTFRRMFPCFS